MMQLRLVVWTVVLASAGLGACGDSRTREDTPPRDASAGDSGPPITTPTDAGTDAPPPPDAPSSPDAPPPIVDTGPAGPTYEYVVSYVNVARADPAGSPDIVPGLDIDGRVSDDTDPQGCFHWDFVSPPPDSEPGVDNQLGPILDSVGSSLDLEGTYAEGIANGSLIVLLRISGVDDASEDPAIELELFEGSSPSGAPMLDATGELAPGQSFSARTLLASAPGAITGGRVRVELGTLPLPFLFGIALRQAQVRVDVGASRLDNGVIGGAGDVDELVGLLVLAGFPESLARSILEGQADLSPDAMGACQEISTGFVFEAVPAVIE